MKTKIDKILRAAGVKYSVTLIDEGAIADKWQHDAWRACFTNSAGQRWEFDYKTGIGHRKSWQPVNPPAADVLRSLILDSDAHEMSFEEFCSEFGYDDDSRAAERTYNLCRETAHNLRMMLDSETIEQLKGELE